MPRRMKIMTELAFRFLKSNTFYVASNGQIVQIYCDEKRLGRKIMEEFGCFTGRIGSVPGIQMWNSCGGHIGDVTEVYRYPRIRKSELDLIEYATAEQVLSYEEYKNVSLDTEFIQDFLSFEKFSAWMQENSEKDLLDE